jgi:hypothetical protein
MTITTERLLFEAGRNSRFTKYDVQAELSLLGRQLPHLQFNDAQERLLRAAGVAGWSPLEIPERICSPRLLEVRTLARELGLSPSQRTPTKLSRVLFEMALSLTPTSDLVALADQLSEIAQHPLDLSYDASDDDGILFPILVE